MPVLFCPAQSLRLLYPFNLNFSISDLPPGVSRPLGAMHPVASLFHLWAHPPFGIGSYRGLPGCLTTMLVYTPAFAMAPARVSGCVTRDAARPPVWPCCALGDQLEAQAAPMWLHYAALGATMYAINSYVAWLRCLYATPRDSISGPSAPNPYQLLVV